MTQEKPKTSTGLEPNIAALLCYVLTWLTGIIFIVIEKDNKFVKFHAWQSLIAFGGINVIMIVVGWIPFLGWAVAGILGILELILWIVCMMKAYQGQMFKLPIAGNIAEKQVEKPAA